MRVAGQGVLSGAGDGGGWAFDPRRQAACIQLNFGHAGSVNTHGRMVAYFVLAGNRDGKDVYNQLVYVLIWEV